jgi:hypothetical protein
LIFFLANHILFSLEANFLGAANTANNIVYRIKGTTIDTKQRKKVTNV